MEAPFLPRPDRSPAAKPLNPAVLRRAYGFAAHITAIAEEFGICCYEKQGVEIAGDTADERTRAKKQATVAECWARGWECTHGKARGRKGNSKGSNIYRCPHCGGWHLVDKI